MLRALSCLVALLATAAPIAPLAAQATGTVSGRIINVVTQQPVGFVAVRLADRTTRSDADGRFVIADVAAGTYTVRATFVGFSPAVETVTVVSGQATDIVIALQAVAFELDAITVTGYGEVEKRDLTGVVAEVPAESFNAGSILMPEQLIRGKVAGVQVAETNGGEPGGGVSIRIRGGTSITSSNEPLYVVDGVPLPVGTGRLQFLNPNDIASFTVLKDASATAIYGSQGANGVVLIETRSGKGAVPTAGWGVSYRGTFSGSTVSGRPSILTADEFRTAVEDHAPQQAQYLGDATTDWVREVEQTGYGQEHTVAVLGGGENTSFRGSFGYLSQEGVLKASKTERYLLNLAFNQLLFDDRLSLQANLMGQHQNRHLTPGGVVGAANNFAPTQPIFDTASVYGGYFEWDNPLAGINPVGELNLVSDRGTSYRSLGNVTAVYATPFLEGLSATGRVGYVVETGESRYFAPSNNKNQVNRGVYGTIRRSPQTWYTTLFDGFLTYTRNFDLHALTFTGGYAFTQGRTDTETFYAENLSSNFLGPDGVPTAQLYNNSIYVEEDKLGSWFGRANYSFKDRYLVTATVRRDGSSRFGPGNQWGTFPSAAVAWRLSEEEFLGDVFSDLKLRLSWGKNGNQAFPSYRQYKSYAYSDAQAQVQFGNEFISTIRPSAADPNIKWEETTSWNFGLDYGLSANRFTGAIEYYTKTTKDLIFTVLVPSGVNLSNVVTTNVGTMKNKGLELSLNAMLADGAGGGLSWDASLNLAYNKNELVTIDPFAGGAERILSGDPISGGVGSYIQVLQPGQPVNSFLVYEHIRDDDGKPIWEDINGLDPVTNTLTGLPDGVINDQDLYVDQHTVLDTTCTATDPECEGLYRTDGRINQDDRVAFQKPAPDWIMGFTSSMRYKSFDLSFTLLAQLGSYLYNNVASNTGHYQSLTNSARPNNLHSSVLDNGFETPQYFSDEYVEDASFLRLENIELGYTFQKWLRGMRVFGVVQNLFTLTGYSGVDPTASITGIDNNRYPRTRTFTAGLNVTF
jgi:iron complex outermembrane receptor protein